MAQRYAIRSRAEAEAYLQHLILAQRLRQSAEALLMVDGKSATEIMGFPDDMKLRSSMTLFAQTSIQNENLFHQVLNKYYQGQPDERTLALLER